MKNFTKKEKNEIVKKKDNDCSINLLVIVLNFSIPNYSQAFDWNNIAGDLLKELVQLVASLEIL